MGRRRRRKQTGGGGGTDRKDSKTERENTKQERENTKQEQFKDRTQDKLRRNLDNERKEEDLKHEKEDEKSKTARNLATLFGKFQNEYLKNTPVEDEEKYKEYQYDILKNPNGLNKWKYLKTDDLNVITESEWFNTKKSAKEAVEREKQNDRANIERDKKIGREVTEERYKEVSAIRERIRALEKRYEEIRTGTRPAREGEIPVLDGKQHDIHRDLQRLDQQGFSGTEILHSLAVKKRFEREERYMDVLSSIPIDVRRQGQKSDAYKKCMEYVDETARKLPGVDAWAGNNTRDRSDGRRMANYALQEYRQQPTETTLIVLRNKKDEFRGTVAYSPRYGGIYVDYLSGTGSGAGTTLLRRVAKDNPGKGISLTALDTAESFYYDCGMHVDNRGHFAFTAREAALFAEHGKKWRNYR